MSGPRRAPISDEAFDVRIGSFLAAEAADVAGAPTAAEVAARLARRDQPGRRGRPTVATRQLRTVLLMSALGLLLGLVLALMAAQRPVQPPRLTGNGQILVEDQAFSPPSGGAPPLICEGCRRTGVPSWSADGTRLAFASDGLWVHDTRTGAVTELDACPGCSGQIEGGELGNGDLSMAPAGDRIAYVEGGQLKVVDVAMGAVRSLTQPTDGWTASPSFSPDGTRIAFVREEPGVWVIDADGGTPRRIIDDDVSFPSWSPDGTTMAYVRWGGGSTIRPDGRSTMEVWLHDLDTGARGKVLEVLCHCLGASITPGWSPDGTHIAVVAPESESDPWTLFVLDVRNGQLRRLGAASPGRPAWQPIAGDPTAAGAPRGAVSCATPDPEPTPARTAGPRSHTPTTVAVYPPRC
jgi:dipeptidyl aminopeptidase/acylaminoacyl peptidase